MMPLTTDERDAVATICLLAAFADGQKEDAERERLRSIADGLGAAFSPERYQRVLLGQADLAAEAATLTTPAARTLAYEMAVAVCDADGHASDAEQAFLDRLGVALGLESATAARIDAEAAALVAVPTAIASVPTADVPTRAQTAALAAVPPADVPSIAETPSVAAPQPAGTADVDAMVLNYAVLNGALELLPQTLATVAIVPLQTKMVYRIGLSYGYTLDQSHVRELLATVGLGLTSQVVESYARGLVGGAAGGLLGGLLGGVLGKNSKKKKKGKKGGAVARVASAATGAAFTFGATYALGRVAAAYYGGGRTLASTDLKGLYEREVERGRALYETHRPAVEAQARTTDLTSLLAEVRAPLGAPNASAVPNAGLLTRLGAL